MPQSQLLFYVVVYALMVLMAHWMNVHGCFTHSSFFHAPLLFPLALRPRILSFFLLELAVAPAPVALSTMSGPKGLAWRCTLRGGLLA